GARTMNLMKKIGIGILVILRLLVGGSYFLLGTASGLKLLLTNVARWVPGLSIANVSGDLRNLTLQDVRYQMPGIQVNAQQYALSLDLSCLLKSQLCINNVAAQQVNIQIDSEK